MSPVILYVRINIHGTPRDMMKIKKNPIHNNTLGLSNPKVSQFSRLKIETRREGRDSATHRTDKDPRCQIILTLRRVMWSSVVY